MNEKSEKILTTGAEQHVLLTFSVDVGKIREETKKFLDSSSCHPSVSRALVYKYM